MSQSVDRALTIVSLCAEHPRTLGELAAHLDVHRSTVLRLLQTMERRGFMRRGGDATWQVGLTLTGVALTALDALELRGVAQPHLRALSREFGHTVHLAELTGSDIVYVDKIEGRGAVRMQSRIGAPVIVHTAAVAKAILASSEPGVRDELLRGATFERHTDTTITDRDAYLTVLEAVRGRGWAEDDGEWESYLSCVAVPVFDHSGSARGALSVTALRDIEPLDQLRDRIPRIAEAAREISRQMGWKEPTP